MKHTIWKIQPNTQIPFLFYETSKEDLIIQEVTRLIRSGDTYAIRINQK